MASQSSAMVDDCVAKVKKVAYQVAIVRQKKTPIHIRVRLCASDILFIDQGFVGSDRSQA